MHVLVAALPMVAGIFGGWEIALIPALALILFGARKLPDVIGGLREGISAFCKATRERLNAADDSASDAGKSLGGIYGKPAAQALTVDNQVAELYDRALLRRHLKRPDPPFQKLRQLWKRIRSLIFKSF